VTDLTIVICTYNRPQRLKLLLEDLSCQTADKNLFRVLVVDNASSSATKKVFEGFLGGLNISYVCQPKVGLSYARNMGIEMAATPYIAYLDDDVRLDNDWTNNVLNIIGRLGPDVFGGSVFPYYDTPRPAWFLDKYAIFSYWGDSTHSLQKDEYLSGNNIVFKKALLVKLGGFNPSLGMRGCSLGYHEEAEIVKKARQLSGGINILYVHNMPVRHLVPAEKMSLFWQVKHSWCLARSNIILFGEETLKDKISFFAISKNIFYQTVVIFFKITFGGIFRDRKKYKYYRGYLMERAMYNFYSLFNDQNLILFKMRAKICSRSVS
jgi:GT2 family glycosyltransferase